MNHKVSILLLSIAAALAVLLGCLSPKVQAAEAPDLSRKGEISLQLREGHQVTLYRVAEPLETGGNYLWRLTEDFAGSRLDLTDLHREKLPRSLCNWADMKSLEGVSSTAGKDGRLVFPDLEPGLYLLRQKEAGAGFYPLSPFLVTVPRLNGETWVYEVDAMPKTQLVEKPGDKPNPKPNPNPNPKLPQTGQLNWPVPVLAGSGLLLFALGLALYRKGREEP